MYIKNESSINKNKAIGSIICESAMEVELLEKPKLSNINGRRVVGSGTIQRANSKNRNGRWYSDSDLFPQLTCPRTKELLRTGFGSENGHPLTKDLTRQQTIDPNNVVAYFLKFWTEGDLIKADFIGSNLPIGEAFDQDLRSGLLPAWSLRALGSVTNTARGAEVKNIKVVTWDRVYYPSHPEAYTDGVVSESARFDTTDSGIIVPKTPTPDSCKVMGEGFVEPILNKDVINYIKAQSKNFKTMTESFEIMFDSIDMVGEDMILKESATGTTFIVNVEDYILDEIYDTIVY